MAKNDGKAFELLTKEFFSNLFEKIGYIVHKERIQFNGTQDGFDVQFKISENYIERNVYIECKDYSTDLRFGSIYSKAHDLESNYKLTKNDLAFFISPRANFANNRNSEKSEPIFNGGKFPFEIRLFELSNGVNKLFAIDKDIYRNIYKKECPIIIDENKEIERFKSIIQSKGVLKKIIINEIDRESYITNITKQKNHIQRIVSTPENRENDNPYFFSEEEKNESSLVSQVKTLFNDEESDGIVLIGNPGIGKSSELKELAINFWENRNSENWIPFFRNINTFLPDSEITEYLPEDWKHIPQLLIILDGIDEIPDIIPFRNKLEKFTNENYQQKIKYILSCRTNIYETSIKNISNFKCFHLNELYIHDAYAFLKYEFLLTQEEILEISNQVFEIEFLKTPFYLSLLGEYFKETKTIPSNKAILIEKYIEQRLLNDFNIKFKNKDIDISDIKAICKKIALTMEGMQISKIKKSLLNNLLSSQATIFTNCSFIDKIYNEDNWKFEHRNIQEFFVANALSNLSFDNIIKFIQLDESTPKAHPSWSNSISYLLNCLNIDEPKYIQLLNWLKENDIEIILKADPDRVPKKMGVEVFQKYFHNKCLDKNLWFGSDFNNEVQFYNFAKYDENISFLISIIEDLNQNKRAIGSATNIISIIKTSSRDEELKVLFLKLLSIGYDNSDFDYMINILYTIRRKKYYLEPEYLNNCIRTLNDCDFKNITSEILHQIYQLNCDDYIEYIKFIIPKFLDEKNRKYKTERGNDEKTRLKEIFEKLEKVDSILLAISNYIEYKNKFSPTKKEIQSLINKLSTLFSNDENIFDLYANLIIDQLKKRSLLYNLEDVLISFFRKTNTIDKAFKYIYDDNTFDFNTKRNFLSKMTTSNNLNIIVEEFKKGSIEQKEIIYFRNNLSYQETYLAKEFESIVINETSFNFENKLFNEDLRKEWAKFHKGREQLEFDLLFNPKKIILITKDLFNFLNVEEISWEVLWEGTNDMYDDLKLTKRFPEIIKTLINNILSDTIGKMTLSKIVESIKSELFLLEKIKEQLNTQNTNIIVRDFQKEIIKKWCFKTFDKVDFKIPYKDKVNYQKCHLIWFFRHSLDLIFSENMLLDMLTIDGEIIHGNDTVKYDYIIDNVKPSLLNTRIEDNILNNELNERPFKNHAFVAIENNLKNTFPKIEAYLSDPEFSWYYQRDILETYIEKTENIKFLKTLVKSQSDDLSWNAIYILLAKSETDFVIEKLLEFLKTGNSLKIITTIFKTNYSKSFSIFNEWIKENIQEYKNEINYKLSSDTWSSFNNIDAIPDLIELIHINNAQKLNFGRFNTPMTIVSNVLRNIAQKSTPQTCLEIIDEVNNCINTLNYSDTTLFHLNTIIENTQSSFYKLKSNPMTFPQIAKKIENDLKYELI